LAALTALALSACQTAMPTAVVERAVARVEALPNLAPQVTAPQAAAIAPTPAAAAPAPLPSLEERLGALLVSHAPDMKPVDRARVAAAIRSVQDTHGVDPLLVLAIIEQESDFDSHARGPGGSLGLMQVRPFVARDVAQRHGIPWSGNRTLFDPAANVAIGSCYLADMLELYPDPALAIAAYNLGPYRVQRMVARGKVPRPPYLISVLARFQTLSSEFGPAEAETIEDALAD
jgi:soluble lytic murein transglycosylase-like protein